MTSNNELIIFIHLAKTGGTTLRNILDIQYGPQSLFMYKDPIIEHLNNKEKLINMLRDHIYSANAISGHFGFGMKYDEIDGQLLSQINHSRNITYISMLRKPVDRIFSQYHHYKRNNWIDSELTFEQFIKHKLYVCNYQTLRISGTDIPSLNIAKKNILNHFALVGITDMYKESLFFMKNHFNWKNLKYNKLNSFIEHSIIKSIPNELIVQINNDNNLDVELYEFVKDLLNEKIKSLSESQRNELHHFSPFI
ncbi:sulfotransferase family 2 domain-containing protein [Bacillus toyonensis]|uniref:sulfotransferase family 2 domain-containing protein n=1 Tax=Bacillus toyonensis TaxID=155322 RepID=UPI00156FF8C3|nr:sulfotransferase family 2 domain-containing protein [Bacillus toyonensis]NSL68468.1 sulfotransferase family 2 domain-containing protein [Bacillus toyonensis]